MKSGVNLTPKPDWTLPEARDSSLAYLQKASVYEALGVKLTPDFRLRVKGVLYIARLDPISDLYGPSFASIH